MIDRNGYRSNVGIILLNSKNEVFWGRRIKQDSWQFPQGGIKAGESPEQAMHRELTEEVGLHPHHVKIIGRTRDWLRYEVPDHFIRRDARGHLSLRHAPHQGQVRHGDHVRRHRHGRGRYF